MCVFEASSPAPPFRLNNVPREICYTPDYLTENYLVEVQGFGRSQEIHMKVDKLKALTWWHEQMEVLLFLYDSLFDRHTFLRFHTIRDLCFQAQTKLLVFLLDLYHHSLFCNLLQSLILF